MKKLFFIISMLLIMAASFGQTKYASFINGAEKVLKESLNDPFSYVRTTAKVFDSISVYDMTYYFYYDSLKTLITDISPKMGDDTRAGLQTSMRINESYQKDTVYPLAQLIDVHKNLEKRLEKLVKDSIANVKIISRTVPEIINRFNKAVSTSKNRTVYCYLISFQYRAKNGYGGYVKAESEYFYYPANKKYEDSGSFPSETYTNILENRSHPNYKNKKLKIPIF
jgi:hypothetical protein